MNKELDAKLCSDFPVLFCDRYEDETKTCMCWGFDCGDGWEPIIRYLSEVITNHVWNLNNHIEYKNKHDSSNPPLESVEVHATQVKEKFGTLRFYVDYEDDFIHGAISMAEHVSGHTCEICGKEGKLNNEGWLSVRCDEHRKMEGGTWND